MNRPPDRKRCPVCLKSFVAKRRTTCSSECRDQYLKSKCDRSREKIYNDFLPADAEENKEGIWVPSIAEIAAEAHRMNPNKGAKYT